MGACHTNGKGVRIGTKLFVSVLVASSLTFIIVSECIIPEALWSCNDLM